MEGRARKRDPVTSHMAVKALKHISRDQNRILKLFNEIENLTDSELEQIAIEQGWPMAGKTYYRRRRSELKNMNLLTATSHRRPNAKGNSETVWTLTQNQTDLNKTNIKEREKIMENNTLNDLGAAWEEGLITFTQVENNTFAIKGLNLTPGTLVEAITKEGETRQVKVGKVLQDDNGLVTASFEWANTASQAVNDGKRIFTQTDDGTWLIKGQGLIEGEQTSITLKDGKSKPVIVKDIIHDESGIQTATFENVEIDLTTLLEDGRLIFIKSGNEYFVKGKNLKPATIVKVTKSDGSKVKVTLNTVFPIGEDGYHLATFDWEKKNDK